MSCPYCAHNSQLPRIPFEAYPGDQNKLFNFKNTRKKEKGCTEPLYGKKSKCIIKIVPKEDKCKTFQMDEKCKKTRK